MQKVHKGNEASVWSNWTGIIIVVLGVYLTAAHGNELMVHAVLDGEPAIVQNDYFQDCPREDLQRDGISQVMCTQATRNTDTILLSRPDWYRGLQMALMSAGTLLAFASIFAGVALIEHRTWSAIAAIVVLSGLLAVDLAGFLATINSGPLLGQLYLWHILLWFFIHAILLVAVLAGRDNEKELERQEELS